MPHSTILKNLLTIKPDTAATLGEKKLETEDMIEHSSRQLTTGRVTGWAEKNVYIHPPVPPASPGSTSVISL